MGVGMGSSPKDAGKGLDREAVSDMYIMHILKVFAVTQARCDGGLE